MKSKGKKYKEGDSDEGMKREEKKGGGRGRRVKKGK